MKRYYIMQPSFNCLEMMELSLAELSPNVFPVATGRVTESSSPRHTSANKLLLDWPGAISTRMRQ